MLPVIANTRFVYNFNFTLEGQMLTITVTTDTHLTTSLLKRSSILQKHTSLNRYQNTVSFYRHTPHYTEWLLKRSFILQGWNTFPDEETEELIISIFLSDPSCFTEIIAELMSQDTLSRLLQMLPVVEWHPFQSYLDIGILTRIFLEKCRIV